MDSDALRAAVARLGAVLLRLRFPWFLALIWIAALAENGLWVRPGVQTLCQMASDPFHNVIAALPMKHYLYTSYLGLLLAHVCGAYRHVSWFAALHLLELLVGGTYAFCRVRSRWGDLSARWLAVFFLCSPLSNDLLNWLGIGDNLVFIFSTLALVAPSGIETCFWAFLLGLSHAEQGLFIALVCGPALALLPQIDRDPPPPPHSRPIAKALLLLVGTAAASVALHLLFAQQHFDLQGSRVSYFFAHKPTEFLSRFFRDPTATFFSLYLVGWIPVTLLFAGQGRADARFRLWFLAANLACLALVLGVFDITRVFALVSWPVAILGLQYHLRRPSTSSLWRDGRLLLACGVLSLIVPKIIVWNGQMHTTARYCDAEILTHNFDYHAGDWTFGPF